MFKGRMDEWMNGAKIGRKNKKKGAMKEKIGRNKDPSFYCFAGIEVVSADRARGEIKGIDETELGETRIRA